MAIEVGQRLLHYRVVEKLGEGGMGVVWRALDTSLDRDVALKFLPDGVVADRERLARLEREARLLASLSHPNIAAVYGLHQTAAGASGQPGQRFIAMELVAGESLAERLERSRGLPLEDTLEIVSQVAEALEAAHERGVIHRDLKPANVMIRPDGSVKVLDFGLARSVVDDASAGADSSAQTEAARTRTGQLLGTVLYMSPEQLRGKAIDKRVDIWALGCVLYECLSGRRPYAGESLTDVIANIVSRAPDFAALTDDTPVFLVRMLRRCLEKDPRSRLRDAGELRVAIEEHRTGAGTAGQDAGVAPRRSGRSFPSYVPWMLAGGMGVALLVVIADDPGRPAATPLATSRWSITLAPGSRVDLPSPGGGFDFSRTVAVSQDGAKIAFSVQDAEDRTRLYLKEAESEPRAISGTLNGRGPFFSPDGEWLGYYDNDDHSVYKVPLGGGSPQRICDIGRVVSFDASWAPDGRSLVFATDDGLWQVSADAGAPRQLTRPDPRRGEVGHHAPRFTNDGRNVLFTVAVTPATQLAMLSLDSGVWETLLADASLGVEVPGERLLFARSGELLMVAFDHAERRISGSSVSVLQDVDTTPGLGGVVLTQFDVSQTGTLVYVPAAARRPPDQLLWVDVDGRETLLTEGPGSWVHPRLSPDGRRISLDIHRDDGMRDVHLYELERRQFRRLTRNGMSWESEWSPDGAQIAFLSGAPAGQWSLFLAVTDFSAAPELIHRSSHVIPGSWFPDGQSLLFTEWVEGGIWRMSPGGGGKPELVLRTGASEGFPRLSPDGNWMAYVETESGLREVFVQRFPELGPKHKVSVGGGGEPVWAHDGRRLYYRGSGRMYVVDVTYQPEISFDQPRLLFEEQYDTARVGHQHYDISPDGERFLVVKHGQVQGPGELRVVLHWLKPLAERP